jgi:hypothetical protein
MTERAQRDIDEPGRTAASSSGDSPRLASVPRIVDIADPLMPRESGYFVSVPVAGRPSPHSNDVDVYDRRVIYFADRVVGFDILELRR